MTKFIFSVFAVLFSGSVLANEIQCNADIWYYGQTENNQTSVFILNSDEVKKEVILNDHKFTVEFINGSVGVSIEDMISGFKAAGTNYAYFSNVRIGYSALLQCTNH